VNIWVDTPVADWGRISGAESLVLDTSDGELPIVRTSGRGKSGDSLAIFSGHGLRIALRDPAVADRAAGLYHGAISVQGLACSTSLDGLQAADALIASVQSNVWGEGSDPRMIPGRVDICTDVEVQSDPAVAVDWWEREVYAFGNVSDACRNISTRARSRGKKLACTVTNASIVGERDARTLYLGKDPKLRIYPKCRDPNRDVAIVKARWDSVGWSGETEVLRIENQVSREWLCAQRLVMENGEAVDVDAMSWAELRPWLPELAREALSRHRHTDYSDTRSRGRQRKDSQLWRTALSSVDAWERRICARDGYRDVREWRGVGELLSIARTTSEMRMTRLIESAAARLHLAHAARGSVAGPAEIAYQVVDSALRGEGVHQVEKLDTIRAEYARRMGWPAPRRLARGEGTRVELARPVAVSEVEPEDDEYAPDESP
jgi:hypothetical protein